MGSVLRMEKLRLLSCVCVYVYVYVCSWSFLSCGQLLKNNTWSWAAPTPSSPRPLSQTVIYKCYQVFSRHNNAPGAHSCAQMIYKCYISVKQDNGGLRRVFVCACVSWWPNLCCALLICFVCCGGAVVHVCVICWINPHLLIVMLDW